MFKEMPVIPVDRVVDTEKNNGKKWRAEEEDRHMGSLTPKTLVFDARCRHAYEKLQMQAQWERGWHMFANFLLLYPEGQICLL
jgi:hypothetical protein